MLNQSVLFIALRYIKGSKKQRFATFVATLATLGIAIGVNLGIGFGVGTISPDPSRDPYEVWTFKRQQNK